MIEHIWRELRETGTTARQRRIDAAHPLDLYADFTAPENVGLVAVCGTRPTEPNPMRALAVEIGFRSDGRWSLRISLLAPALRPVFLALCNDIITVTRTGVDEKELARVVLRRLEHWRTLLERDGAGLGEIRLRGLIGELLFLDLKVCAEMPLRDAVAAWTGPRGTPQDFLMPSGHRIEVKTVNRTGSDIKINGLSQLDAGADPLDLAIVRVEVTAIGAKHAVTASSLVNKLRDTFSQDPEALAAFDAALASVGWHEHPSHEAFVVRPVSIEIHEVHPDFPRLTTTSVPNGIEEAHYVIRLPGDGRIIWKQGP